MALRTEVRARGIGTRKPSELAIIAAWSDELFGPDRALIEQFEWQDKTALGLDIQTYIDDTFAGFAHVFVRQGLLDGAPIVLGALGGVMTATEHQGQGVGSATVEAAGAVILRTLRAELGVLLCKPALIPFYARLRWRRMLGAVTMRQAEQQVRWPHETMVLLREETALPGTLDLGGLPF